jgi:hypothetical protein
MLEQAVVDANALREVALKHAESVVIEKHSAEVKKTLQRLLEQDELGLEDEEDPFGGEEEGMLDAEMGGGEPVNDLTGDGEGTVDQLNVGALDGTNTCPCPDQEEDDGMVEINFDELGQMVDAEMGDPDEVTPRDDFMDAAPFEEEPLEDEEEFGELEESLEFPDDELLHLVESLVVDIEPVGTGWARQTVAEEKQQEAEMAAYMQNEEIQEEINALRSSMKELQKENKQLNKKVSKLVEDKKQYKSAVIKLKKTLTEVNLSNAKLLYTNKILNSDSLNERQKEQIVETISRSSDVEEVKLVFETLQSAVGSTGSNKPKPKSLSEAIRRGSSISIPRRKTEDKNANNPLKAKWQVLAGIKTNN